MIMELTIEAREHLLNKTIELPLVQGDYLMELAKTKEVAPGLILSSTKKQISNSCFMKFNLVLDTGWILSFKMSCHVGIARRTTLSTRRVLPNIIAPISMAPVDPTLLMLFPDSISTKSMYSMVIDNLVARTSFAF